MKKVLHILVLIIALVGIPSVALELNAMPEVESQQFGEPSITVHGQSITVQNAQGETIEVYNITGVREASAYVDSNERTFNFQLKRGCYIVKVGKVVRKISIK